MKHRVKQVEEDKKKRGGQPEEMTKVTKQAIIDARFDFATVSGCISDIRKSFWNIERVNEFYRNKLKATHSHFYNQMVPGREDERAELTRRLKQGGFIEALNLVDNPLDKLKKD